MLALVPAILLGLAGLDAFDGDAQPGPLSMLSRRQAGFCHVGPWNRTMSVGTPNHSHVRP